MSHGLIRRHPDFRRLWLGQSISQLGSQVSALAIPLTAVLVLHASTFAVSLLTTLQYLAFLVLGLPAGAWIDRIRRRPLMITADVARAAVLVSIPIAAALHRLTLLHLYAVVIVMGLGTLLFDVAYQSYLPRLVLREQLVAGSGALEASRSVASVLGPGLAGWLIQAVTAPVALLLDAASFGWSAAWLTAIKHPEPEAAPARRREMLRDIGAGLRLVFGNPTLRALGMYGTAAVVALAVEHAIEVVFLVRTVRLTAATIGLLSMLGSLGAIIGAITAPRTVARFGAAHTMIGTAAVAMTFRSLIPLTGPGPRLALFALGSAVASYGIVAFNVVSVTYRQQLCPDHMLGRMNATIRFLSWGAMPLGALLGGTLGTLIGLRAALWVSAGGGLLAILFLVNSPLRPTANQAANEPPKVPAPQSTPDTEPAH